MKRLPVCITPVLLFLFSCANLERPGVAAVAGDYSHTDRAGVNAALSLRPDGTFVYTAARGVFSSETSGKWRLESRRVLLTGMPSAHKDSSVLIVNSGNTNSDTLVVKISRGGHYAYDLYEHGERVWAYGGDNQAYLPACTCDSLVVRRQGAGPIGVSLKRFPLDTLHIDASEKILRKQFDDETWKYRAGSLRSDGNGKFKRTQP